MNSIKNTNLDVAQYAMSCVNSIEKANQKKYKTLVKKMSALIQRNGLILTLAFVFSKGTNNEHGKVLEQMRNWCTNNYKLTRIFDGKQEIDNSMFIEKITSLSQREYVLVTREMIVLFGWIKRFADGMIEGEE
ncbi:type III-B CRISPR module-associated protein Cmr5 [Clostridium oryzae]|uniref:CRISPR type III-B/RAMP module-associated protein Cmr5 n=1 Tax=Clostridium oryzae TaxID=1450648 RepID=A0A1V4IS90_9CLOT|nr:type III-B CRISPR module-associated protein Cmr5 [Clostridium oryzae]OPJ62773.1 CRISPR-associated protein [Clostridium oryzae]